MAKSYMPGISGMFGVSTVREYEAQYSTVKGYSRKSGRNTKRVFNRFVKSLEALTSPWPVHFSSRYILGRQPLSCVDDLQLLVAIPDTVDQNV